MPSYQTDAYIDDLVITEDGFIGVVKKIEIESPEIKRYYVVCGKEFRWTDRIFTAWYYYRQYVEIQADAIRKTMLMAAEEIEKKFDMIEAEMKKEAKEE